MNELKHYGVKGMRWGVSKKSRMVGREVKREPHAESSSKFTKKSSVELSTEELRARIERINLERKYSEISPHSRTSNFEAQHKRVKTVLGVVGTVSAVIALKDSPAGKLAASVIKAKLKQS